MALLLSRVRWNVPSKIYLPCICSKIYFNSKRHLKTHHQLFEKQKCQTGIPSRINIISYAILTCGLGYVVYKWKSNIYDQLNIKKFSIPVIHAKAIDDVNKNREKYNFIADVVEVTAPSVVYIEIADRKRIDFFTGRPITTSNGSGFIVDSDGLILTNAHVVINKPNTTVMVRLQDGSNYSGIVEDVDLKSDLATIRINKKNCPVMKLGNSSNLRPGEFVVAIGSPLSLSNTITSGVVSSVNRLSSELGLRDKHISYIQTDAAITFGNSGGPLVNLNGEAIGINSMKVTSGISFAIPIDYAKEFLGKVKRQRKLGPTDDVENVRDSNSRRYMGITVLTLTPEIIFMLQQRNGNVPYHIRHGVLIWKVVEGSPADKGGIQSGDIITHVNNQPVVTVDDIYTAMDKSKKLLLNVVRNTSILHVIIEVEEP